MAIKKFYSNKAKPSWKFDGKQFWSYGFDIRLSNGKRKRESGFATKQLAENAVARIRISEKENKYELQTRTFPLVSEVLERRLLRIENRAERVRAERVFRVWLSLLPSCLRYNELQCVHYHLFIDYRLSQVCASSVGREINIIASAIRSAFADFPELANVALPKIPRPKVPRSRRERLISSSEIMRLLTALLEPQRTHETNARAQNRQTVGQVFQFALLTGARIGEITALRWEQIDFGAKILQIVGTKTKFKSAKVVRYLEITPTIEKILRERQGEAISDEFVFSRNGRSITHYYEILSANAKLLGINYGKRTKGGFVTHDARHTAITQMLQSGVDLSTIGSITGHSDANLILHYSHATRESRKNAVSVLENFVTNAQKKAS